MWPKKRNTENTYRDVVETGAPTDMSFDSTLANGTQKDITDFRGDKNGITKRVSDDDKNIQNSKKSEKEKTPKKKHEISNNEHENQMETSKKVQDGMVGKQFSEPDEVKEVCEDVTRNDELKLTKGDVKWMSKVKEWPKAVLPTSAMREIQEKWSERLGLTEGEYDVMPATPLQTGMVVATMRDRSAYVGQVLFRSKESIDLQRLTEAFKRLVAHHDILRAVFVTTVSAGIVMVVRSTVEPVELENESDARLNGAGVVRRDRPMTRNEMQEYLSQDHVRGFEVGDRLWVRLAVLDVESNSSSCKTEYVVVLTIHHALYDGWSVPMLYEDLVAAYTDKPIMPRPTFRGVVDYIFAQDTGKTEDYWLKALAGVSAAEPLMLGHAGHSENGHDADVNKSEPDDGPLSIPSSETTETIEGAARAAGVTVAVMMRAAWALTLRKYTRSSDVVFGHVVSNREIPVTDADQISGPLLNTVPCRVVVDDDKNVVDLVRGMQEEHGAVLAHSHAGLLDVTRWAGLSADAKLFSTLFVYENMPMEEAQEETQVFVIDMDANDEENKAIAYSYELAVFPGKTRQILEASFDEHHMDRVMARSVLVEYDYTLTRLVESLRLNKSVRLADMWELSPAQQSLLDETSRGDTVALPYETVHAGFEARARLHPDRVAVEHGEESLTYGQLDAAADALAARLAAVGVCVGSRVSVFMRRSLSFVAGLAGVLRAGGAVVPVDASFPAARVQFMLADAGCRVVVASPDVAAEVDALGLDDMDIVVVWADAHALASEGVSAAEASLLMSTASVLSESSGGTAKQHLYGSASRISATGDDEFMVVYTSGSTGKPKGVPVNHSGIANVIHVCSPQIGCVDDARVAQFMAIGFDGCQWEVWSSLNHGCTLVLREDDAFATARKVDVLMTTPTGLRHFGAPDGRFMVRHINLGGEAVSRDLIDAWSTQTCLQNNYGPTEIAILSHTGRLNDTGVLTVGRTIANARCYILDDNMLQVPVGVAGEVVLGGIGVSPGYIGRPDLTAERFVIDPFAQMGRDGKPARMFKTGDLGRLHADGRLEILGRMDDQVKLRGYRIELDEVAGALMRGPGVMAAAAVVKDGSVLVGFVTPSSVDTNAVREAAAAMLPMYMVPAVIVALESMPTNVNGKTDKKALAQLPINTLQRAPTSFSELKLASSWSRVLNIPVESILAESSFYELGGNSISTVKLVRAISQSFGVDSFSTNSVFLKPTLQAMAAELDYMTVSTSNIDLTAATDTKKDEINESSSQSRPLRILCLHGKDTNPAYFAHQLKSLEAALGDNVEFVFIQGPFKSPDSALSKYYPDMKFYTWFPDDATQDDLRQMLDYLISEINSIGPVDGLLGFSMGAYLVWLLDHLAECGMIERTWRISVNFSGGFLSTEELDRMGLPKIEKATPMDVRLVYACSTEEDDEEARKLRSMYREDLRSEFMHEFGHDVPRDKVLCERIAAEILKAIETVDDQ